MRFHLRAWQRVNEMLYARIPTIVVIVKQDVAAFLYALEIEFTFLVIVHTVYEGKVEAKVKETAAPDSKVKVKTLTRVYVNLAQSDVEAAHRRYSPADNLELKEPKTRRPR